MVFDACIFALISSLSIVAISICELKRNETKRNDDFLVNADILLLPGTKSIRASTLAKTPRLGNSRRGRGGSHRRRLHALFGQPRMVHGPGHSVPAGLPAAWSSWVGEDQLHHGAGWRARLRHLRPELGE